MINTILALIIVVLTILLINVFKAFEIVRNFIAPVTLRRSLKIFLDIALHQSRIVYFEKSIGKIGKFFQFKVFVVKDKKFLDLVIPIPISDEEKETELLGYCSFFKKTVDKSTDDKNHFNYFSIEVDIDDSRDFVFILAIICEFIGIEYFSELETEHIGTKFNDNLPDSERNKSRYEI